MSVSAQPAPSAVMLGVAALLASAAAVLALRPMAGDMARYARRIAVTMLAAGAIILGEFAFVLDGWTAK